MPLGAKVFCKLLIFLKSLLKHDLKPDQPYFRPQGSPSVSIIPCYDGRTLAGVQKVVKDGLSVISIKQSHRNCQFSTDPITKLPQLSCAQGIKDRNSFWDLHKPDLSKVKGLECATSESVTQLLKAHSAENAGKPTYKRKILRLLGSLVTKKTLSPTQICVMRNDNSWPVNTCVLSSVCRETEIKQNGIVGTQSLSTMEFSANIEDLNREQSRKNLIYENNFIAIENEDHYCKSDVDISLPSSSKPYDLEYSHENMDITLTSCKPSDIKIISSCIDRNYLELDNSLSPIQSCPIVKSNSAQIKTSLSSQLVKIPKNNDTCFGWTVIRGSENDIVDASLPPINENNQMKGNSSQKESNVENELNHFTQLPAEMEQFVFTEMLKDMKDIEDYISAYISSFCILEEFDNYAAIKSSSEVVSNFLNEMQSSGKDLTVEILEDSKLERKKGEDTICTDTKHKNSNFLLKEQSQENCLKKISNQNVSSYCYWEDEAALTSFEIETTTSTNHLDKVIIQENSHRNTALVPLRFFDDIWKNSLKSLGNDDFLQYEGSNDAPFPLYCPSTSLYDPTVLEEAETIVHAVDSFLNGCFYTEQSYIGQNIPCTITELDDDYDEPFNTGTESSRATVNHGMTLNHKISNTQAQWNESQILIQSNKKTCSATNKNDKKDSKSNEDIANFLKTTDNNIDSNYTRTASAPESNQESTPLLDKKSRDIISVCDRFCEPTNNLNNVVEETNQTKNKKFTNNYDVTNKNSINENPSMKGPRKKKQMKLCSEVSSPLNVHKTRLCSTEYKGNPNDISVNPLEENIKPELKEKNSNRGRSRFVHIQEDNNGNSTKTNYLFSSPNVQLNLTNPLSKERK